MKFDSGNFGGGESGEQLVKAHRAERERVVNMYLNHLGLGEEDLMRGKKILDVGAGSLAAFGDGTLVNNYNCEVVSIDRGKFIDVSKEGINQRKNLKIGGVDFENLKLAEREGFKEEPEFDLILSSSGPPYTIVNFGEHIVKDKQGVEREDLDLLRTKIESVVKSAADHLKVGGRAVFYPFYQSEIIDFGPSAGGKKDFRAWRKFLDEALNKLPRDEEGKKFMFFPDLVPDSRPPCSRLIIRRLK
jgi:hypothetical protein